MQTKLERRRNGATVDLCCRRGCGGECMWWLMCVFAVWRRARSLSGKGLFRQSHTGQREA